jgi:nitric oxide reductase NorE protein
MSDLSAPAVPASAPRRSGHIPGEAGVWVLIGGDLVLFSFLFATFLFYRAQAPDVFGDGRAQLDQALGLCNTLLMLTSSWFVASGVVAIREGRDVVARRCFGLALACGAAFVAIKYFEYGDKLRSGITMMTNDFFMFYFAYTGLHLIHVLIGMGVLTAMALRAGRRRTPSADAALVESGASFWHLVDLLWIVLFALLYLVA